MVLIPSHHLNGADRVVRPYKGGVSPRSNRRSRAPPLRMICRAQVVYMVRCGGTHRSRPTNYGMVFIPSHHLNGADRVVRPYKDGVSPQSNGRSRAPPLQRLGANRNNMQKREAIRLDDLLFVLALPIFPGRLQPSIVGRSELNFRVRDGNGWTLTAINTNYVLFGTVAIIAPQI